MLKNFFKLTYLFSALLSLTQSPEVYAQTQQTQQKQIDAVAFLPVSFWMNELKNKLVGSQVELNNEINNYQYTSADSNMHFVSERVVLNSQITTQFATSSNSQFFHLKMQLDQARVQAHQFDLQVFIKKDLGFGTAVLKLDMHCDAIEFQVQNTNPISTEIHLNQGEFQLSQIDWNLKNSQIQTRLIGCNEVAGFDELLKQQIQQTLEQSFVLDTIRQMINSQLTSIVNEKISSALKDYTTRYSVVQNQTHHFDELNNLWIYSGKNPEELFTSEELLKVKQLTKAALLVKKNSVETTAKQMINEYLIQNKISSENVSEIKNLTCSRFIQFFVWPSLRSLSKCFEMKFQTQVSELKITDLKKLTFQMKVGSWVSGESHSIAYFEAQLTSSLTQKYSYLNSFAGRSDPEFIKWSGRSKRISISLIQPSVETLLKSSLKQISQSAVFKMFQQKSNLKQLSPETFLVELQ